jgi:hypothetical protein
VYIPNPLDTSNIELSSELLGFTEQLAEDVHDNWAQQRIAEGWVLGVERNDTNKTHPCLVPYGDLPESERVFDRNIALQTLKLITLLGYEVVKIQPGDPS